MQCIALEHGARYSTQHGVPFARPGLTGAPALGTLGHAIFDGAACCPPPPPTNCPLGAPNAIVPASRGVHPRLTWRTGGRARKRHSLD